MPKIALLSSTTAFFTEDYNFPNSDIGRNIQKLTACARLNLGDLIQFNLIWFDLMSTGTGQSIPVPVQLRDTGFNNR